MKKITFLILLFLSFLNEANSQVLISQSFDTALTWTPSNASVWTRQTAGTYPTCSPFSGAGMAKFASYDYAAGTAANLTSPAITFAGASYRVKFSMYRDSGYPTDADNIKVYYNTSATHTGGTLLGTINRSRNLAPVETSDGWYTYYMDISGTPTGTGYIILRGTSAYGNNTYVDQIEVSQIQPNDAEMNKLNMASIITAGNSTVSGIVKNLGSTAITSFDLNWQVDSGATYTQQLTGLNIAAGQTYNFTHANQWTATPGAHSLKVWVSNLNNGATDANLVNNEITKSISVASNSTTRLPLYEKFSSSTCGPCATFNGNYFGPFLQNNESNLALVSYQVNWPGAGDPYYTSEIGTRVSYYSISGAPTLLIDSRDGTNFSSTGLQTDLTNALAYPSYFALSATRSLAGNNLTLNVTTTPYLTGTYKLYAVVVEKLTTGNVASNGETEFHNVVMKMLPDGNGTVVNFVHDVPVTTTLQASLTGLNIEEMSDLEVIVFVQNASSKEIMQSAYATDALSNVDIDSSSKIKMYPNPSNGIVRFISEEPLKVVFSDLTGKVVYSVNQVTTDTQINLSFLQKGVYFAKIEGEKINQTQKIILK